MNPVLRREVMERQQNVAILVQALHGLGVLALEHLDKCVERLVAVRFASDDRADVFVRHDELK